MAYYRQHSKGSLSRRDSLAFVRDCLQNATQVEFWWQEHGGIKEERKTALLQVYDYVSWESFNKDKPTFAKAFSALQRLQPGYIPFRNKILRFIYTHMGYGPAAMLASWYRGVRKFCFAKKSHCL
jgi:hypothetical protein